MMIAEKPESCIERELDDHRHVSLCETLDRVLNKGVVVAGEVVISVAEIDLIYLNLRLMLSSFESAHPSTGKRPVTAEGLA